MIELRMDIGEEQVEALESFFCEELQQNWILYQKHPRESAQLRGYFEGKSEAMDALQGLTEAFPDLRAREHSLATLEDQDWKLAYRHHLKPWSIGHLHWIPEWERDSWACEAGHVYLYLDSGMAFGTGSHETTRLCAEALYAFSRQNPDVITRASVIDAGCGSGILAMSAHLLGYSSVYAFDRDPEAVKVTRENSAKNGMHDAIEVSLAGLEDGLEGRRAQVIMANIQADVLAIYAEDIVRAWEPAGGVLILSGILNGEESRILEVFGGRLAMEHQDTRFESEVRPMGDWVSVVFTRVYSGWV